MKFALHIIVVFLLCGLLQSLMPWWTMAVGAFITGLLFGNKGYVSFAAGFIGIGLLWALTAWYTDSATGSILGSRVAGILPVKTAGMLIVVTTLIGALVGGLSSMTGGMITAKERSKY
jgi:hypothetical protein